MTSLRHRSDSFVTLQFCQAKITGREADHPPTCGKHCWV